MPSRRILPITAFAILLVLIGSGGGAAAPNASAGMQGGPKSPTNTSLPTITGKPIVGQTLTGSSGKWSGAPATYTYQWDRCDLNGQNCKPITTPTPATATTYLLVTADFATTIRLAVMATNKNGSTVATSNATASIQSPPTTTSTSTTTPTTSTSTTRSTTTTTTTPTSTTTTTTPSTPSGGNLFWSTGFESGNLGAFGGVHTGLPGWGNSSATVVPQGGQILGLNGDGLWSAPAPQQGKYSVGLLTDGPLSATGSAGGQRAELTSGYMDTPNTERWYGLCVYVPSVPNKLTGIQDNAVWESGWGTSLNFKISGHNDNSGDSDSFQIANAAATSAQKNGWSSSWYHVAPLVYDQWVCFTIHVYWSTGSGGYFEIYENGKLLTLTGLSCSFSGTRVSGPNYGVQNQMVSEFDVYRDPQIFPNLMYFDSLKIGDTYAVVQPG